MVILAAHESGFFLQIFFDKDVSKHRETCFAVVIAVKNYCEINNGDKVRKLYLRASS